MKVTELHLPTCWCLTKKVHQCAKTVPTLCNNKVRNLLTFNQKNPTDFQTARRTSSGMRGVMWCEVKMLRQEEGTGACSTNNRKLVFVVWLIDFACLSTWSAVGAAAAVAHSSWRQLRYFKTLHNLHQKSFSFLELLLSQTWTPSPTKLQQN